MDAHETPGGSRNGWNEFSESTLTQRRKASHCGMALFKRGNGQGVTLQRHIGVNLTRDKDTREAVARLLTRHGQMHLDGGTLTAELTPSGKDKGRVRLRCEVAGEVVGHAAASTITDRPEVFRRAASGPVEAQVVIRDFNGTPWSAATALLD